MHLFQYSRYEWLEYWGTILCQFISCSLLQYSLLNALIMFTLITSIKRGCWQNTPQVVRELTMNWSYVLIKCLVFLFGLFSYGLNFKSVLLHLIAFWDFDFDFDVYSSIRVRFRWNGMDAAPSSTAIWPKKQESCSRLKLLPRLIQMARQVHVGHQISLHPFFLNSLLSFQQD